MDAWGVFAGTVFKTCSPTTPHAPIFFFYRQHISLYHFFNILRLYPLNS